MIQEVTGLLGPAILLKELDLDFFVSPPFSRGLPFSLIGGGVGVSLTLLVISWCVTSSFRLLLPFDAVVVVVALSLIRDPPSSI